MHFKLCSNEVCWQPRFSCFYWWKKHEFTSQITWLSIFHRRRPCFRPVFPVIILNFLHPWEQIHLKKNIYQYLDSRFPTVRPETFDCVFQVSANLRRPFYSSQCEFTSALTPLIVLLLRNLKKVSRATNSPRGENELAQYLPNRLWCPDAHQEKTSSFPHTPPTQFFSWKNDVFMKPL